MVSIRSPSPPPDLFRKGPFPFPPPDSAFFSADSPHPDFAPSFPPGGGPPPPPFHGGAPGHFRPDKNSFGAGSHAPPCSAPGSAIPQLIVLVYIFAIFFLVISRRLERPRRRLSTWASDCLRQIVAFAASNFAVIAVLSSTHAPGQVPFASSPVLSCRVPTVADFLDTTLGLMLFWPVHTGLYAVLRLIPAFKSLRSGVYQSSVSLFFLQTSLLALCLLIAKLTVATMVTEFIGLDTMVVNVLLRWTWHIGPGAEVLMIRAVYPLLFATTQLLVVDRIIRHKSHSLLRKTSADFCDEAQEPMIQSDNYYSFSSAAPGASTVAPTPAPATEQRAPLEVLTVDPRTSADLPSCDFFEASPSPSTHSSSSSSSSSSDASSTCSSPSSISSFTSSITYTDNLPDRSQIMNVLLTPPDLAPAATTPAPPDYPLALPEDEDHAGEELPTYDDSQRQALQVRERERQRVMDVKRQQNLL
ncbi:hypothetical protein BZA70DRAFT_139218 [Myxozyma melibiosi]|uniref:Uncharacterized protein n=1 Tax=Myxozyma melibiosi TaxID=54550 RepID=A0ABR1F7A4_9ASCO